MAVTNFKTLSLEEGNRKLTGKIKKKQQFIQHNLGLQVTISCKISLKRFLQGTA